MIADNATQRINGAEKERPMRQPAVSSTPRQSELSAHWGTGLWPTRTDPPRRLVCGSAVCCAVRVRREGQQRPGGQRCHRVHV